MIDVLKYNGGARREEKKWQRKNTPLKEIETT